MADTFSTADSQLVDAIAGLLAERGAITEDQLIAELKDRGVALQDDPENELAEALEEGDGLLTVLVGRRWASLPALLAGRVFTHRLTGPEVEHEILAVDAGLGPVAVLFEGAESQPLVDGSLVVQVFLPDDAGALAARGIPPELVGDAGALLLPPGCLRAKGLGAGDVIGLRVTDDGLLLEGVPDQAPAEPADLRNALTEVLEAGPEEPLMLDAVVWTACADDPALFTEPLPPLPEALDACGLPQQGGWLASPGFDFDRWRIDTRIASITQNYRLDNDAALAVLAIVTEYERVAAFYAAASDAYEDGGDAALAEFTGGPQDSLANPDSTGTAVFFAVLPTLADPAIAEAVLGETIGFAEEGAAALGMFAETLEPQAPRGARPALRWLCGKAYERLGNVAQAEAEYQAAESLDPQWSPALVDLARFAGDRGDAAKGLALLRRADAPPDHPLVELFEQFQSAPRTDIGRNDPCWCGSGRKYKKCHLHGEARTLDERAAWLYRKAALFVENGPGRMELIEVAAARAEFSDERYALLDALDDPLVGDAVLFEGGEFAEFVTARGALLPEDERLLAEQWLLIERSLFEVEQVRIGEGCTLRDVRTGDVHEVRERTGSLSLKTGMLICARVVPTGETTQIFGGIEPVALHQRDELIALLDAEPDPVELVSFLSRRFAPPVLQNTEGDPLVMCEATLRADDPAALAALLDDIYERADGAQRWLEQVTTNGMTRVRATLHLDGHDLSVEANSEARIDRVLATLGALDTKVTVVNQSRESMPDLRQAGAPPTPDDPRPEVAAVLEQFVRDYERKWLDERIPALAGRTPREAAADPTRRDDLIRLLDSFPRHEGQPGTMDPDRLRAALDLGSA